MAIIVRVTQANEVRASQGSAVVATGPVLFGEELASYLNATLGIYVVARKIPQKFRFRMPSTAGHPLAPRVATNPDSCIIVLNASSSETPLLLSGSAGATAWRAQFDAYATTAGEAELASELLRRALQDFSGPMGRMWVKNAVLMPRSTGYTPGEGGDDSGIYRFMSEYRITVREPAPDRG